MVKVHRASLSALLVVITLSIAGCNMLTGPADGGGSSSGGGEGGGGVDATPDPNALSAPSLASEDDSGASDSDGITNQTTALTLSGGNADSGAQVRLLLGDGSTLVETTADGNGAWSVDLDLAEGSYILRAAQLDGATPTRISAGRTIVVDTTAPTEAPLLLSPRIGLNTGADRRPDFRWTEVSDGGYAHIQASGSSDFSTIEYDWANLPGSRFEPESEMSVSTTVPVGRRYWVRIRAVDAAGNAGPWHDEVGAPKRYVNVGRFDGDFNGDGYSDLLIGDYYYDPPATTENENIGRVYLFHGAERASFDTIADFIVNGKAGGSGSDSGRLGMRLGFVGDVNGDGFQDFAASAISWGNGEAGEVYLFFGGDSKTGTVQASSADLVITNPTSSPTIGRFGWGLSGAGDVNGDGYADFLLGGYRGFTSNQSGGYPSYVALFLGGQSVDGTADAQMEVARSGSYSTPPKYVDEHYGIEHGPAGDLNGDGYADFVVGRPLWRSGQFISAGRGEVYFGASTIAASPTPEWTIEGTGNNHHVGVGAYGGGDLNGDGLDDLLVGTSEDEVWLFFGDPEFNPSAPDVTFIAPPDIDNGQRFGDTLAPLGDFDGDGIDDLLIGAKSYAGSSSLFGRAAVYYGSDSFGSSVTSYDRSATGQSQESHLASALGSPGDVDGDGRTDLLLGEWGRARARLYFGREGPISTDRFIDPGAPPDRRFSMGIGRGW